MRILGPIILPSTALMAARDPEIVGGGGMLADVGPQERAGIKPKPGG
jgi:hypothetical protein